MDRDTRRTQQIRLSRLAQSVPVPIRPQCPKRRQRHRPARHSREVRIRLAITELGPTFIKLGQILSTRPDLVGVELAEELTLLQDDIPADTPDVVRHTVESELRRPLKDIFSQFDPFPLASASIGQVHRARTKSGELVAVKVQHAAIQERIRVDLDILAGLAQLAERIPEFHNYRPCAVVAEFQRMLRRELDFGREQRNLQQFGKNFRGDCTLRVPRTHPDLSTPRVLTMEFLEGVPLTDISRVRDDGFDLDEVARRGADVYLTMIFKHGFYHADPHPGNVILMRNNVIGLVDFGMVGRIDDTLHEQIEEMLMAIAEGDAAELTSVITRLGEVPPRLDHHALSLEVADFVSHYVSQPIETLNLSAALKEMTGMIRRYNIMLPARVALLLKARSDARGRVALGQPPLQPDGSDGAPSPQHPLAAHVPRAPMAQDQTRLVRHRAADRDYPASNLRVPRGSQ